MTWMNRVSAIAAGLLAACALFGCGGPALAQDSVIASLPAAASLTGTEYAPLDQGTCPNSPPTCTTVRATLSQIKTWIAAGTVTSVTVTTPTEITNSGCAITASGTCALTWTAESANRVLAGPTTGSAATPAFRALVAADIPSLSASYDTAGVAATFAVGDTRTFGTGPTPLNLNGSTGDIGSITIPATITKYRVSNFVFYGLTSTPGGTITVNLWTGASATGTEVATCSNAQLAIGTTPNTTPPCTASAQLATSGTLHVNMPTANGSTLTGIAAVTISDYTGN